MPQWVAFLRGVNVGGHAKLPMKPLCAALTADGFCNVQSYIQSGNLVFDHSATAPDDVARALRRVLKSHAGLTPQILVMTAETLADIYAACPFPAPEHDPKTLHFLLLSAPAKSADLEKIQALRAPDEDFALTETAAYLLAPSGIGRSKLMAAAERLIGVPLTARNLRSLEAVLALCTA